MTAGPTTPPSILGGMNSASQPQVLSLGSDTVIDQQAHVIRHERNLWHQAYENWPTESALDFDDIAASVYGGDGYHKALVVRDTGAALISLSGGTAYVNCFGDTRQRAAEMLADMHKEIPRSEDKDPDIVPVTFWALSPNGPQSIRRKIDAPAWGSIEENYPNSGELTSLLQDWSPGVGGQLLLWHGEAGVGKTTALRSLGREWRDWADLHYVVDPEKFFGESASYMLSVMMGEGEIEGDGDLRWRLLILEDCGELLAPDAKQQVGQSLSRLLNACDGLIGRGLRLLILVTTNEPLEKVHPAISRPGRCASRIEFERFDSEQALAWLRSHGCEEADWAGSRTLADLYALREGYRTEPAKSPIGFALAG